MRFKKSKKFQYLFPHLDSFTYPKVCIFHFGHHFLRKWLHILIQETDIYPFHELNNIHF